MILDNLRATPRSVACCMSYLSRVGLPVQGWVVSAGDAALRCHVALVSGPLLQQEREALARPVVLIGDGRFDVAQVGVPHLQDHVHLTVQRSNAIQDGGGANCSLSGNGPGHLEAHLVWHACDREVLVVDVPVSYT